MSGSRRHPWIKFYPTDWRGDAGLRGCSLAARGLWMDMLSLMHEADPYGHLIVNGRVPTTFQLASMLGASSREVTKLLAELEAAGVFSRTENGVIYSRRMLRDKEKDERDQSNGRLGGNPRLKRDAADSDNPSGPNGVNPPLNGEDNTGPNGEDKAQYQKPDTRYQKPERKNRSLRSLSRACAREADFAEWWAEYPRKVGKDAAQKAYEKAVTRCSTAELLLALRRQRWPADPGFIPHPATWLNQGRWQDDPAAAAPDRPKAWRDMTPAEKDADLMARWGDNEPAPEPTPFPTIEGRLH